MSFASGDDGQIGSALQDLGIFAPGLEELGRSVFKDCIVVKSWAPGGFSNCQEAFICVS